MSRRFVVHRVHNNNVIHAIDEHGRSVVLTGLGVGYRARRGQPVDPQRVELTYVLADQAAAGALADALSALGEDTVLAAQDVVQLAATELNVERPERLLLPIADHLEFAVRRAARGSELEIPLAWEVSQLYPRELAVGHQALEIAARRLGAKLPASEAAAFALHFVSCQLASGGVSDAVLMTHSIGDMFDVVDAHRGRPIDRGSAAAARFVTHIRYLFVRLTQGGAAQDAPPLVREALATGAPRAMDLANDIADVMQRAWKGTIGESERAYIGLHAYRLLADTEE